MAGKQTGVVLGALIVLLIFSVLVMISTSMNIENFTSSDVQDRAKQRMQTNYGVSILLLVVSIVALVLACVGLAKTTVITNSVFGTSAKSSAAAGGRYLRFDQ